MKLIRQYDERQVVHTVAKSLHVVTKLYGFNDPDDPTAAALTKFVIDTFPQISPEEIEMAFRMAAMNELNVKIEAFGRTLIIPTIAKVLNAYTQKKVLSRKPEEKVMTKEDKMKLRKSGLVSILDQVERFPDVKIWAFHYDFIDRWVHVFPDQQKIDKYNEMLSRKTKEVDEAKPLSLNDHLKLKSMMNGANHPNDVKIAAKVELAEEWLKENIINRDEVIERIKNYSPLKSII